MHAAPGSQVVSNAGFAEMRPHLHPRLCCSPAAIAARMSLREQLLLLPQRLERFPDSAKTEMDSVGLALQLALAPLQRAEVDAATVEGLGKTVEVGTAAVCGPRLLPCTRGLDAVAAVHVLRGSGTGS